METPDQIKDASNGFEKSTSLFSTNNSVHSRKENLWKDFESLEMACQLQICCGQKLVVNMLALAHDWDDIRLAPWGSMSVMFIVQPGGLHYRAEECERIVLHIIRVQ